MNDSIKTAIEQRKLIQLTYDGLIRIVQPYILGKLTTGNLALSAYQISGESNSIIPDWKTFTAKKIENISMMETFFEPIPSYNPKDPKFISVIIQI